MASVTDQRRRCGKRRRRQVDRARGGYRRRVPRKPRPTAAGIYHVTTRSIRGHVLFESDFEFRFFLLLLQRVVAAYGWECIAYCLMSNHYHLLIFVPEGTLSAGFHRLNSTYAHWFNERHGYHGHVFSTRFYSGPIEGDGHLLEAIRYIVLNPVRAGLCARPGQWRWSSHRAVCGEVRRPRFLATNWIALFAPELSRAREIYVEFVEERRERGPPPS
jgi:putative transposase